MNQLINNTNKPSTYRRDFPSFNKEEFQAEVQSINREDGSLGNLEVNLLFELFYAKLFEIIDRHFHVKKLLKRVASIQANRG